MVLFLHTDNEVHIFYFKFEKTKCHATESAKKMKQSLT